MYNTREEKTMDRLTEFQLANILKNMNFVKNILN